MGEDKWVRVMSDYSSDGLWARDGVMFSQEDLPVHPDLIARLQAWCSWYEKSEFYRDPEERTRDFDVRAFAAEGLEIARAIKAQLPDWTVVYHDEAEHARQDEAGEEFDRARVEYEITL